MAEVEENNKKTKLWLIIGVSALILLIIAGIIFLSLQGKGENRTDGSEPAGKNSYNYEYEDGVLTVVVDENGQQTNPEFTLKGIVLIGNQHDYLDMGAGSEETVAKITDTYGYKQVGIYSSFYPGETIKIYVNTDYSGPEINAKIIVAPHKTIEEYDKMTLENLKNYATKNDGFVIDYKTPDANNHKYVGEGRIGKAGKYDVLFVYKGKVSYFVNINSAEVTAE